MISLKREAISTRKKKRLKNKNVQQNVQNVKCMFNLKSRTMQKKNNFFYLSCGILNKEKCMDEKKLYVKNMV